MAATIVPIIAAAAPLITPAIKWLAVHVENLFGAGTGPTKLSAVVNAVTPIVQQLATSGKIPGQLDTASIVALVESVVQSLKADGVLNPDTARIIASQPIATNINTGASFNVTGGTLQISFGQ